MNRPTGRELMSDVPQYLEAMKLRGRPVLAGVVENVTEEPGRTGARVALIRNLGYRARLIALNSMHARPTAPRPPRNRGTGSPAAGWSLPFLHRAPPTPSKNPVVRANGCAIGSTPASDTNPLHMWRLGGISTGQGKFACFSPARPF